GGSAVGEGRGAGDGEGVAATGGGCGGVARRRTAQIPPPTARAATRPMTQGSGLRGPGRPAARRGEPAGPAAGRGDEGGQALAVGAIVSSGTLPVSMEASSARPRFSASISTPKRPER